MVDTLKGAGDGAFDLLLLDHLPGVGPVTLVRLVRRFGSARGALGAPYRDFAALAGAEAARGRSVPAIREAVEQALASAAASGTQVVTWGDAEYPQELFQLADPPAVLFLRGRSELLTGTPAITLVGARRATGRGRDLSGRLGTALARAGATVVSGLALGVDGAAHAGALRAGGHTIAVLGTGADVPYPRAHRKLFDRISEEGLLVSEFAPGTGAAPHHFPRRNRILAALASTVVVVEAGSRSGSLITVDHALDLGRDVWAVPGPIDTSVCVGSNRLLTEGARALVSIEDFVRSVVHPRTSATSPVEGGREPTASDPEWPCETLESRMLAVLAEDALPVDELSARFLRPVPEILAVLTTLELHGEVVRLPGLRFRRAA